MNADLKVCCINVPKQKVKYNDWGTGVVVFRFILQNVICLYRRYLYIVMTGSLTTLIIIMVCFYLKHLVRLEKTTNSPGDNQKFGKIILDLKPFGTLNPKDLKKFGAFYFCLLIIHLHKLKIHIRPQNFVNHLGAIFINHLVI